MTGICILGYRQFLWIPHLQKCIQCIWRVDLHIAAVASWSPFYWVFYLKAAVNWSAESISIIKTHTFVCPFSNIFVITVHLNQSIKGGTNPWFCCANSEATVPEGNEFVSKSVQNGSQHLHFIFVQCSKFQNLLIFIHKRHQQSVLRFFSSSVNVIGCNGPSLICSISFSVFLFA